MADIVSRAGVLPAGIYFCAVVTEDGGGVLGAYGPWAARPSADKAAARLREAGVHPHDRWEIVPLHAIDVGIERTP